MTPDRLIELAFRDSESYQVPMTEEGMKLAEMRYHAFIKGWKYHEFYMKTGDVCMKDYNGMEYDQQLEKKIKYYE